jgi:hypothetical protein
MKRMSRCGIHASGMPQCSCAFARRHRTLANRTRGAVQPGRTKSSEFRVLFSGAFVMRQLFDALLKGIANAAG